MSKLKCLSRSIAVVLGFFLWTAGVHAIDSDVTRSTLSGIQGVNVVVEELQPNLQKYASKFGLQKEKVKADVEASLRNAGIEVLNYDQWLKAPGRPFLYVVINTHEYEKYWYAYALKVELRQSVLLELNPSITTMAGTWGINMAGTTNVGKLNTIKEGLNVLMAKFIEAYQRANAKDPGLKK